MSTHEKVIEFKMEVPARHYRVTLRKAGDHSVRLVSLHPGMLTGVNVHTQEWVDAIRQALLIAGDSRQWPFIEVTEPRPLRVRGVGRIPADPRAILVALSDIPTDDEIRELHDVLREWDANRRWPASET